MSETQKSSTTTIDMNFVNEGYHQQQQPQQYNVTHNNSININIEENHESNNVIRNGERSITESSQNHYESIVNEGRPEILANTRNNEFEYNQSNNSAVIQSNNRSQRIHSWRMNLNNVLSFAPSAQALRTFLNHSSNLRYVPLNDNNINHSENSNTSARNSHSTLNIQTSDNNSTTATPTPSIMNFRVNINMGNRLPAVVRQNLLQTENINIGLINNNSNTTPDASITASNTTENIGNNNNNNSRHNNPVNNNNNSSNHHNDGSGNSSFNDINADIPELVLNIISMFVRYLPFIFILILKFLHDHSLNIMDLLILQHVINKINNSLRKQIAKLSQKSYNILIRDSAVVICTLMYRLLIANAQLDPFGLIIRPHNYAVTFNVLSDKHALQEATEVMKHDYSIEQLSQENIGYTNLLSVNKISLSKKITLDMLLYYVAVNDLILKLFTQLCKIIITMLPTKILRHKPRAHLYVLTESCSQFYRALAPIRLWLQYLRGIDVMPEIIAGILFCSIYIGAKVFELVERSRFIKRSLQYFLHPNNYERKPTNDELNAAGAVCPICHDSYNSPIVLQCGHIFCDDCVSTWFKREQTCPMCRTKVSEDPTYQDGSTTFFYQLY